MVWATNMPARGAGRWGPGAGLLGEQPGLVEGGGGGDDVAHAAVVQHVVQALGHEAVELDHHGADCLLVPLDQVEAAELLLGAGLAAECSARSGDDPLLGADGARGTGPGAGGRGRCGWLIDVGGGADDVLRQPERVEGGLGLPGVDQVDGPAERWRMS